MLHIAGFVTVYEAFLEMELHVDLFRRVFIERALPEGKSPKTALVGGFALQKRPKSSVPYLAYSPSDSNGEWHSEWFYIKNPVEAPFLMFTGGGRRRVKVGRGVLPINRKSWRSSNRSFRSSYGMASTGCGSSTPSSAIGLPRWGKGRDQYGNTPARWILTAQCRRSS